MMSYEFLRLASTIQQALLVALSSMYDPSSSNITLFPAFVNLFTLKSALLTSAACAVMSLPMPSVESHDFHGPLPNPPSHSIQVPDRLGRLGNEPGCNPRLL